jgi:hypothetical protein
MDVFSTELGIRLCFVKTSEFRGGGVVVETPNPILGTPLSPCILIAIMSTFPITPSLPQATVIHEHELGWHDGVGGGVNSRWRRPGEQAQVTSGKHVVVHPTWQTISPLTLQCWVCFMCGCTHLWF